MVTNRKVNPKRQAGIRFDAGSYRQAITRAAKQAGVPHWFPYQLRHVAATEVRKALGVESAQALLGHSRADMTQHYTQVSEDKAIEAAYAAPSLAPMSESWHRYCGSSRRRHPRMLRRRLAITATEQMAVGCDHRFDQTRCGPISPEDRLKLLAHLHRLQFANARVADL